MGRRFREVGSSMGLMAPILNGDLFSPLVYNHPISLPRDQHTPTLSQHWWAFRHCWLSPLERHA